MDLRTLLSRLNPFAGIPAGRKTVMTSFGQPAALSHTLTVDRVLSILRAAEAGECLELFALYRDILLGHAHTQTEYNKRKLSALTKALTIGPVDKKNPQDIAAAAACKVLTQSSGWLTTAMSHLLNGHLYPLAILEQEYAPFHDPAFPNVRFAPYGWHPVQYHLLDWTLGYLQIWEADPKFGQRTGNRSVPDPSRFIIHRGHLLTNIPDHWGGPMRAALFWYLFAVMDRDWWVRFLDRFGAPFIVGRYDQADDASRTLLSRAFSQATRLFGLVVTKETDIQVHSIATASAGEAFERMQSFANAELSKLILGQTMTTTAQASGLGGGAQAMVQENVRGDIESWDITALAETVNTQIIQPFLRWNAIPGNAQLTITTSTGADMQRQAQFLTAVTAAGLEPTDEGIEVLSLSSGIPLQRRAVPAAPAQTTTTSTGPATVPVAGLAALMAAANLQRNPRQPTDTELDATAAAAAPDLAAAFIGRYAPVRQMIEEASSVDDLMARLTDFSATLPAMESYPVIEHALTAYSANAAAAARTA